MSVIKPLHKEWSTYAAGGVLLVLLGAASFLPTDTIEKIVGLTIGLLTAIGFAAKRKNATKKHTKHRPSTSKD